MSRHFDVFNVGLPRTGTCSTTNALDSIRRKCRPVIAWAIGHNIDRAASIVTGYSVTDPPPLLVCTRRDFDTWAASCGRYFPRCPSLGALREVYDIHGLWVADLCERYPVGDLDVRDGWRGLFHALAACSTGPYPHLNARP